MSKLVMIIDDSPTVRKIIEVSLRREEFEVISYPDGIEALKGFANQQIHRIPDLVILDVELPKMNGYDVARYLRSKPAWKQSSIVMLTGHDSVWNRIKANMVGAKAYLTKPFTTESLLSVVRETLGMPVPSILTTSHASFLQMS